MRDWDDTVLNYGLRYENTLTRLVSQSAFINREPNIGGKTPDILATNLLGHKTVIECTTLERGISCRHADHIFGSTDPNELNCRLYHSIEQKLKKYSADWTGNLSLVIAIENRDCSMYDSSMIDVAFGAWRYRAGKWCNLWEGTEDAHGLFGKYEHCSGILHSTWSDHLFVPNPRAKNKADPDLFTFASIAEPKRYANGIIPASQPKRPSQDAVVNKIRGATIVGVPPGTVPSESVIEVLGYDPDGTAQLVVHLRINDEEDPRAFIHFGEPPPIP